MNAHVTKTIFRDSRRSLHAVLAIGLALLLPAAPGCGNGRPDCVPVSGRVTIDGKPLEFGSVMVVPKGHRPAVGEIGPDGRFSLTTFEKNDGCVPGKHSVAVIAKKILNEYASKWFTPKKYANCGTSGLEVEVVGPRDDVEIKLTWGGGQPFVERYEP